MNTAPNQVAPQPDVRLASVPAATPRQSAADALESVCDKIAPVWPLADFVAVNPYLGMTDKRFVEARDYLRGFSDCELLMPLDYYREKFAAGDFDRPEIEAAIDELVEASVPGAEKLTGRDLLACLQSDDEPAAAVDDEPAVCSYAAEHDQRHASGWIEAIRDEVGKHCSAYYDQGQSLWPNPWAKASLYDAWRSAMRYDRGLELLGLAGVRKLIASLPDQPDEAVAQLLEASGVPEALWEPYLLALAFEIPGWSAWTQYQSRWVEGDQAKTGDGQGADLTALLAMRLAYDVALAASLGVRVDWGQVVKDAGASGRGVSDLARHALHRANELGYQNRLLAALRTEGPGESDAAAPPSIGRKLAQMVFCIDVRSERIRRHVEATDSRLGTLGFAGFFGLPIAFRRVGEAKATNQLPVLVAPKWEVAEGVRDAGVVSHVTAARRLRRSLRRVGKVFRTSAASAYAFVEATGLLFGLQLLGRLVGGAGVSADPRFDGVAREDRDRLGPSLDSLAAAGMTDDERADLAASVLRGMGLTDGFAELVVFCGHGCETENNPLEAGLNCGACGGHSGETNARLAARLLNYSRVRSGLASRGIDVPGDTHFVAALHNTTTDAITFFDTDLVPATHAGQLEELRRLTAQAGEAARAERLPTLLSDDARAPFRRAKDWSELRPEWGLTGNAAFIAGPREMTESVDLRGRSFLHTYDHRSDPESAVLEAILTAPMVVASWINLQYYASTVDPGHFGSGSKTIHNVVGRFGVLAGNGGDLTTGLPWESIHDGERYRHEPVRLLSVVAAPRDAISGVLERNPGVEQLASNGWIHLVAVDDGEFYRYAATRYWEPITPTAA